MLKNIDNAICAGIENGAEGILLTDWGDGNHMQYMPVSYPAVVYCGMRAWNSQAFISERELANALDALVFEDENRVMGALALDAGKYHLYEEFLLPCRTIAYTVYQNGIDSLEKFDSSLKFTAMLIKIMAAEEVSAAFPLVNMSINTEKTQELLKFLEGIKKDLLQRVCGAPTALPWQASLKMPLKRLCCLPSTVSALPGAKAFHISTREYMRRQSGIKSCGLPAISLADWKPPFVK